MGLGIARLLQAHSCHVLTSCAGRSPATRKRAESASIDILPDDISLVNRCDYILSIVPPRDAKATAERIIAAYRQGARQPDGNPLYFLDLNAISPTSVRAIESRINEETPAIRFIDGGIIGSPPSRISKGNDLSSWKRPSIPISGPHALDIAPVSGQNIASVLNTKYLGPTIGTASGLKASFASLTKGFTALAIQSFSTAEQMGVLPELKEQLQEFFPALGERAASGLVGMPKKAYRWVGEMNEIGETFRDDGGWSDANVFDNIAEVYRVVSDTKLGDQYAEGKKDLDEVVEGLVEGLDRKP
ncbi:uncharacterized protein K452DRAFT_292809 [Aplosporella prunicola CBS 121167]|uniref:Phosphogluconate dehydrogenase NAD-binding putative C-terminal domain-containing protein n=1 Tax=Aplosporella prunicola CBS 121167 TaxID=1176127 RepID=A0A6A6AW62_9PEZI|nr:uncharacterized protein K452DRAFT_292809 [Aplosporella prunicola CBS 121167]KAF2135950.1 hypothetical protein K452DRAFT_292809 [Aplosporella prunicola CBS 121167]